MWQEQQHEWESEDDEETKEGNQNFSCIFLTSWMQQRGTPELSKGAIRPLWNQDQWKDHFKKQAWDSYWVFVNVLLRAYEEVIHKTTPGKCVYALWLWLMQDLTRTLCIILLIDHLPHQCHHPLMERERENKSKEQVLFNDTNTNMKLWKSLHATENRVHAYALLILIGLKTCAHIPPLQFCFHWPPRPVLNNPLHPCWVLYNLSLKLL